MVMSCVEGSVLTELGEKGVGALGYSLPRLVALPVKSQDCSLYPDPLLPHLLDILPLPLPRTAPGLASWAETSTFPRVLFKIIQDIGCVLSSGQ